MTDPGPTGPTTIRLTRSGGVAGLSLVASVQVDDLPAGTVEEVRSALAELEAHGKATSKNRRPMAADLFQYDLTVETDGKRRSFTAHDGSLTLAAQTLVDLLLPLARPE